MPALPDGDAVPPGGPLADLDPTARAGLDEAGGRPFGVYLHVPYCTVRCGYCDFNTYTAAELGSDVSQRSYASDALLEVRAAAAALSGRVPAASTVFVGGGTPTVLPPAELGRLLRGVRDAFGMAPDAEVTTEANPDSVSAGSLARLRAAGFNRISFGMQSAVPRVLSTLDRTHDPQRVPLAVREARAAGFASISLDLIYGTPGESAADWGRSLDAALACEPDHVSAYALVVEPGTALAARVRRGELPDPDPDAQADRYLEADDVLRSAGLSWYEVSNWARPGHECRHNLGYWRDDTWWGVGPGAHSHVGGVRFWNVKHPLRYAERVRAGRSPAAGREVLDAPTRHAERVLLAVRLREGLALDLLDPAGRASAARLVADGLVDGPALGSGRVVLTRRGRLLADAVVRALLP